MNLPYSSSVCLTMILRLPSLFFSFSFLPQRIMSARADDVGIAPSEPRAVSPCF